MTGNNIEVAYRVDERVTLRVSLPARPTHELLSEGYWCACSGVTQLGFELQHLQSPEGKRLYLKIVAYLWAAYEATRRDELEERIEEMFQERGGE